MDLDEYIGIPFEDHGRTRAGADCWGLVRMIYAERLNVILPSYSEEYGVNGSNTAAAIARHINEWRKGEAPQPYDVALLRQGGKPQHVGIIVDYNHMLHTTRETGAVLERYRSPQWAQNFLGVYRL